MNYPLHLAILVLLWGYIYTSWALMGRLGLVSFGHGAFMGIGAYTVVMLWNHFGLSPWLGALAALAFTALVALLIGYPCFRFRIVGHYFALVTLALSEVARLVIVALFDCGTSLPNRDELAAIGTEGSLFLDDPWHCNVPVIELHRGGEVERIEVDGGNPYRLELEDMNAAIRGERPLLLARDDALGQVRTIEALFRSAAEGVAVAP